jgi:hypothetical protein
VQASAEFSGRRTFKADGRLAETGGVAKSRAAETPNGRRETQCRRHRVMACPKKRADPKAGSLYKAALSNGRE